ncbi:MAG: alpha/beta fold hydrolase [Chloroflexota bacterium]
MSTLYLDRPVGKVAYDDSGAGDPLVVCVPSMGDLRAEYRFLVPHLVAAGYRVVTMDVRGHGESTAGWPDYSAAAIGSDMVALLRHLNAGSAFLIGTSMAAGAAAWAAAETPDLVLGLVLSGPFVRDVPAPAGMKLLIKLLFGGPWGVTAWGVYYGSLYPARKPPDFAAYRRALAANLSEPGRFGALQKMLAASKAAVEARLPEVRAPTLVLMGTRDPDFKDPQAEARLVGERLRGAVAMVQGADHYPHAELPDHVAPHILAFLNHHAGRAPSAAASPSNPEGEGTRG